VRRALRGGGARRRLSAIRLERMDTRPVGGPWCKRLADKTAHGRGRACGAFLS
jgi:hypothetical protein